MSILLDGRVTAFVEIVDRSSGSAAQVDLIVDTGAELSALPNHALGSVLGGAKWSQPVNFVVGGVSVYTLLAKGPDSEVDTESHGGGSLSRSTCTQGVRVHFIAQSTAPFTGFDGLLGMGLLDAFSADPVKDVNVTRSYLARRV
jgi:hypothetical protein